MNVKAEDIKLSYGAEAILKGVSMEAGNREFVGLIGPNGSGKSTLLKCVYRVLSPDKGAVFLDGKPLKDMNYKTSARSLGVVAQHNYYNFDFSVREVVLMGRSPHKKALERDNAEDYAIVAEALKTVGMAEFANRSFSTLSGGEQQRGDSCPGPGPADPLPHSGRAHEPSGHYPSASAFEDREKTGCHGNFRHP